MIWIVLTQDLSAENQASSGIEALQLLPELSQNTISTAANDAFSLLLTELKCRDGLPSKHCLNWRIIIFVLVQVVIKAARQPAS